MYSPTFKYHSLRHLGVRNRPASNESLNVWFNNVKYYGTVSFQSGDYESVSPVLSIFFLASLLRADVLLTFLR